MFQERLLSSRTLLFSSLGITWQCRQNRWSECSKRVPQRILGISDADPGKMLGQVATSSLQTQYTARVDHESFLQAWFQLIEKYVMLHLTRAFDRLIAMAGIAATLARSTGLNYYYGLWNDANRPSLFASQLLWMTHRPGPPVKFQVHKAGEETRTPRRASAGPRRCHSL